ncbi:MAG TPA: TonB-dependent receptor [Vicinamibacterales bacterium]|nr:TonB-dependent receptor [Vicinamibacterales bacterium]
MRLKTLMLLTLLAMVPATAQAQLQLTTIDGVVTMPDDRPADGVAVLLLDRLGNTIRSTESSTDGQFRFAGVQPGSYSMRAEATPLRAEVRDIQVSGALHVTVSLRMSAVAAEQVLVRAPAEIESGATSTRVTLGGDTLKDASPRVRTRGLQDVLATIPGWGSEDNGLVHVRGVDEGVLYVVDGVPWYERFDGLFGVAPDPMTLESITVSTGYIPPEFGFKSGAVVEVRSAAAPVTRWTGAAESSVASESTGDGAVLAAGPLFSGGNLAFNLAGQRSARFLDPTHPGNFHNTGHSLTGTAEFGWSIGPANVLQAVAGAGRAVFEVPHDAGQEEAGQDQQQRVRSSWQTVSWQRAWSGRTLTHLAGYHRMGRLGLDGSDADTPLTVAADRTIRRIGFLASASHTVGRHLFKVGAEAARLQLHEQFSFAVTDDDGEFTPEVMAFTPDHPFEFSDRGTPALFALYAQDSFRPLDALTIDLGVRFDWSRMLVSSSQVSPRLGIAYSLDRTGTTARASFGRFFQPPQAENLLLASSEQAFALSPFAGNLGAGGAPILPEEQKAFELAVDQMLGRFVRLDVAYWRRWVRNVADPNVFLGTTIIFPNSVARGWASGIDLRVDVPRRRGWSAFASYGNARVEQAGPITGGLFLEDEVAEIAGGERFIPDHDQRNTGAAGVSFAAGGTSVAVNARYESGTPLQFEDDDLGELEERAGAELVDFGRGRVRPRKTVDLALSQQVHRVGRTDLTIRLAVLNITDARWAYNFGNPFSGTHFGPGRTVQLGLRASFR